MRDHATYDTSTRSTRTVIVVTPAEGRSWSAEDQEQWRQAVAPVAVLLSAGPDRVTAEVAKADTLTAVKAARALVHAARVAARSPRRVDSTR